MKLQVKQASVKILTTQKSLFDRVNNLFLREVEMFKFKVGEIVNHKIVKGRLLVLEGYYRQYANGCEKQKS